MTLDMPLGMPFTIAMIVYLLILTARASMTVLDAFALATILSCHDDIGIDIN
jgi:hypothetical protein